MINDYLAVLDIGTTKIVAMVGRKDQEGNLKILGFSERKSNGVRRGLVFNILNVEKTIKEVIKDVEGQSGIKITEVVVGIAGQHINSRQISHSIKSETEIIINKEFVEKLIKEVYDITNDPGEKILHVFPQEYRVNNTVVSDPVGTFSKQLTGTFHITVALENDLKILIMAVKNAGLKIKQIILEPVASAEAVLTEEEKQAGIVLLDIGGGTSDLIMIKDNLVRHTAVIPFGGNAITSDIQKAYKISEQKAEDIKIKYGSAIKDLVNKNEMINIPGINGRETKTINVYTLAEIIECRIKEIIDTVLNVLKNAGVYDDINAGITITGGGSLLKNLKSFIEFRTGLETTIGRPTLFSFNDKESLDNPKYATAIGLLKKGFEYIERDAVISLEELYKINDKTNTTPIDTENEKEDDQNRPQNELEDSENPEEKKSKKVINKLLEKIKNTFVLNDDDEEI